MNEDNAIEKLEGEVIETTNMQVITNSDTDIQINTAKRFPRSIKRFKESAMSMATLDEATAASCFYVLRRGGNNIEGPSTRLSEIVALSWGNLRYGSQIIGETEDGKRVIAEAFCHDLESNNRVTIRVERRITDKYNRKYNDDMIAVTGNAAASIALRNAIFKIVPMTYVNSIYQAAKQLTVGDAKSLTDKRAKMVDHFAKFGVSKDRILARVGKPSLDDIGLDDLEVLYGVATAIKDGEVDIDSAFPQIVQEKPVTLADKVKNKADAIKSVQEVFPGAEVK